MARPRDEDSDDPLQDAVRLSIDASVSWIDSEIAPKRMAAERYYEGATAVKSSPGRSKVIVSAVRDTVHAILPSLGRVFTQTDTIAEFSSDDEEDEKVCKEMTQYVNSVFHKHGGYIALIEGCTDALIDRVGCIRVGLTQVETSTNKIVQDMSPEEIAILKSETQSGEVEIIDIRPSEDGYQSVEMQQTHRRSKWQLECVAPEMLIVNPEATNLYDFTLIGIRKNMPIYEASEITGVDLETLLTFPSGDNSGYLDTERQERLRLDPLGMYDSAIDDIYRPILVTEIWIKARREGKKPKTSSGGKELVELRHMFCIGENHQIMYNEPATCVPLAIFKADLQPHVFFPISLAEDAAQDQDTQTAILRSIIDNVALVNSPRTLANDALVNIEDLKNTAIAAIVRTKNMDAVKDLVTPFVAGETLPILQFLREIGESRTGVTKLSQGLDPNALQAVSRIAANAATQGSDARIEMMARNLAETGVKSLFIAILRVAMYELKGQVQINTPAGFKTIDPSMWHDQVNVVATVGMGNGKIEEKMGTLNTVLQFQQQALKDYGPSSPFMTWDNVRYTIKSMLRLSGLKNVQDYLPLPNPEDVQKWQADQDRKQQEAQKNNLPPPPAPDVVGAAKVKAEADTKMNDAKIQAQTQADLQKMSAAQQNLMAQLQQKHELEMADLQITLQKEMAIAQMQVDAKRDADNQNFAVKSQQVHLDAQQKAQVLQQNAMNNIVNGQKRTVQ